ncbi:helix-turn-helix domain-containing protein [Streptomyces sp. NPDC058671]|uniref:helix-turn-helix domain-containing protein n=1 Tax=Streptomyces sp. NPDC058671 TaxID=3346590 RepID=UPI003654B02D
MDRPGCVCGQGPSCTPGRRVTSSVLVARLLVHWLRRFQAKALGGGFFASRRARREGKQPKLSAWRQSQLVQQHQSGEHIIADLAELFSVSRATVCRVLERHQNASVPSTSGGQ